MCIYLPAVAGYLLHPTRGYHSQKNRPVAALPAIAKVCGHRKSSSCQREVCKTHLLKLHRKSSNKIGST